MHSKLTTFTPSIIFSHPVQNCQIKKFDKFKIPDSFIACNPLNQVSTQMRSRGISTTFTNDEEESKAQKNSIKEENNIKESQEGKWSSEEHNRFVEGTIKILVRSCKIWKELEQPPKIY